MKISLDRLAGLAGTANQEGPLTRLMQARGIKMSAMFRFLDVSTQINAALERANKLRSDLYEKMATEENANGEKEIPKEDRQQFIDELKELYAEEVELPDEKLYESDVEKSPDLVLSDLTALHMFIQKGPVPKGK